MRRELLLIGLLAIPLVSLSQKILHEDYDVLAKIMGISIQLEDSGKYAATIEIRYNRKYAGADVWLNYGLKKGRLLSTQEKHTQKEDGGKVEFEIKGLIPKRKYRIKVIATEKGILYLNKKDYTVTIKKNKVKYRQ